MKNLVKPPIRSSVETTLSNYVKLLEQQNKGTIVPKKKKDRKKGQKNKIFNTPKEVKQKKNGSKSFFPKMENRDKVAFSEFSLVLLALPHNGKRMFRAREIRGWLLPQSYDQKIGKTKFSKIKNKIRNNNKVHTD